MSGTRASIAALLVVCLVVPAGASLVEQATGGAAAYQFDAGTHHDAPDACSSSHADWSVALGATTSGMVVPPEDASDVFVLDIDPTQVGQRVALRLTKEAASRDVAFSLVTPVCGSSVALPENWPVALPTPPAPGMTQVQASPADLAPTTCSDVRWKLKLTEVATPPATVHVAWTDGTEGTVTLTDDAGNVAFYETTSNLDVTLKGAWANVEAPWAGELLVLNGPCTATDGGAVYGAPPVTTPTYIEFTPIQAGPFALTVTATDPAAPKAITMTCHFCIREVQEVVEAIRYDIRADAFLAGA